MITELNRPEADALVQVLNKLEDGDTRAMITRVLNRAVVPDSKPDRKRPSNYDRWLKARTAATSECK
jgi:hypothetical protein